MTIFFSSDTHFSHKNILKYCPERGEKWASTLEMNEGLRDLWNKTVKPADTVYHLGDLFFGNDLDYILEYLHSLNGIKHFIYGNHDGNVAKHKKDFYEVFDSIQNYKEIKIGSDQICLFHYAPRVWNKSHRGSWCLWGHSHGSLEPYGKSVDIGIDSPWVTGKIEHRPFSYEEIASFMKGRTISGEIK